MFHSLLVPVDLSPDSKRVIARAMLSPLATGARLTLLHVVPRVLPRAARARAEHDAHEALARLAKDFARALPRGIPVERVVRAGTDAAEIAKQARAAKAELIVMGRGGGRAFRDAFLGSTAERVLRQSKLPVLVVRQPARSRYRRPLVALDLDSAAHQALTSTLRLVPPPRPAIAWVHAYDAPFQTFMYPSLSAADAQEYRDHYKQKALRDINRVLEAALATARVDDAITWEPIVRYGSARTVIAKAVVQARADVLVLGTHGYAGIAQAFLGSVAGDVLREVLCDVLVVPPRRHGAKAA